MSKNKKKKPNQKQSHMSSKAIIRNQLMTSGQYQQQLALPDKAKEFMMSLPEEERENWTPATLLEIARKAEVDKRVGSLITVFYHIHSIQAFLTGEISNWLDGFNLWIKGLRPAMNDVEKAEDRFFEAMSKIIDPNKNRTHEDYMHDVDTLHEKIMHWEGLPIHWKIGDPLKRKPISERDLEEGSIVVDSGHEEMLVSTVTLPPETKEEQTAYAVSRLNADETADIVKSGYKTEAAATRAANKLAKEDPGHMYVVYQQTIRTQEVATLRPIKAAQKPEYGGDTVNVDLIKKKGGTKA